jgi:hypothetical protein
VFLWFLLTWTIGRRALSHLSMPDQKHVLAAATDHALPMQRHHYRFSVRTKH